MFRTSWDTTAIWSRGHLQDIAPRSAHRKPLRQVHCFTVYCIVAGRFATVSESRCLRRRILFQPDSGLESNTLTRQTKPPDNPRPCVASSESSQRDVSTVCCCQVERWSGRPVGQLQSSRPMLQRALLRGVGSISRDSTSGDGILAFIEPGVYPLPSALSQMPRRSRHLEAQGNSTPS